MGLCVKAWGQVGDVVIIFGELSFHTAFFEKIVIFGLGRMAENPKN